MELAFDILSGEEILNDDKPFSDVVSNLKSPDN